MLVDARTPVGNQQIMCNRHLVLACILFAVGCLAAVGLQRLDGWRRTWTAGDAAGRPARRVICLAPNITETCFALGAGEQVAGVTVFCNYPEAVGGKPRVGSLLSPNFEIMLKLRPDLVLCQEPNEQVKAFCERHKIAFRVLKMHDLDSIKAGIRTVGNLLHRADEAARMVHEIDLALTALAADTRTRTRPRTLLCIGRTPGSLQGIYSVGPHDYLGELLSIAGGDNIFADVERPYPLVSKEAIVARQPQIIIDTFPGVALDERRRRQVKDDWRGLPNLPAVVDGNVFILTEDYLHIPGPRVVRTAQKLAEICRAGGA